MSKYGDDAPTAIPSYPGPSRPIPSHSVPVAAIATCRGSYRHPIPSHPFGFLCPDRLITAERPGLAALHARDLPLLQRRADRTGGHGRDDRGVLHVRALSVRGKRAAHVPVGGVPHVLRWIPHRAHGCEFGVPCGVFTCGPSRVAREGTAYAKNLQYIYDKAYKGLLTLTL